jgi:hypothetical protein
MKKRRNGDQEFPDKRVYYVFVFKGLRDVPRKRRQSVSVKGAPPVPEAHKRQGERAVKRADRARKRHFLFAFFFFFSKVLRIASGEQPC